MKTQLRSVSSSALVCRANPPNMYSIRRISKTIRSSYRRNSSLTKGIYCFGGYDASYGIDSPNNLLTIASQIGSASLWIAAAYLGYKLKLQQDDLDNRDQRECETCGGTGLVDCLICTRWSDGDQSGCSTCTGTRKMACSSCRGGGTAVPIEAKVYIKRESDYY